MRVDAHQKVNAGHLKRNAYLYVRQSSIRQVVEHAESTKRQYALQQHAMALGWSVEQIIVIDSDLGQSGASAADREGFQKLVADVGMGKASSSAWKFPAWHATPRTGIGFWKSAPSRIL